MVLPVRDLTLEEGQKLRRIVRHGQNAIEFKRAQIILASYQGNTPPRIAIIALASEDYIRGVIRAFNEHGMAMLRPQWGPGRPPKFTDDQRKALVALALSRPRTSLRPVVPLPLARAGGSAGPGPAHQRGVVARDPIRGRGLPPVDPHLEDLPRPALRGEEAEDRPAHSETPQPAGRPLDRRDRADPADPARRRGVVPSPASRANPCRVPPGVRDGLLLPHTECVSPALVRSGLSDEACGELAGVSEGRAGEYLEISGSS